jgi:O-antigen ligase
MGSTAARSQPVAWGRLGAYAFVLAACALLGATVAYALRSVAIPGAELVAAGLAVLGVLALAVARYEWAVGLGFALSAIVLIEPAPTDAVFAVVMSVAAVTGRFRIRAVPLGATAGVAAFIALNLIACVSAVEPERAARFMAITIYLCAFALWLPSWLTSEDKARRLLRIYIVVAVISALLGAVALYVSLPGWDILTIYERTRARAFFKDPNVFGPFLVPAALFLMSEFLNPRLLRSGRLTKAVALGIIVSGILFSFSRGAWLNFAIGSVVMFTLLLLRRGGGRHALVFIGVLAVAGVAVLVSVRLTGSLDFLQERAQIQSYDSERFQGQTGGIEIGERTVTGIGPGQFERVVQLSAHSTYIRALAEEGVLGFMVLTLLLYGTLWLAIRNAIAGRDTYGISSVALLAAWCGILASSVFVDTLHWRHLWLVAGLIWAAGQASSSAGMRLET